MLSSGLPRGCAGVCFDCFKRSNLCTQRQMYIHSGCISCLITPLALYLSQMHGMTTPLQGMLVMKALDYIEARGCCSTGQEAEGVPPGGSRVGVCIEKARGVHKRGSTRERRAAGQPVICQCLISVSCSCSPQSQASNAFQDQAEVRCTS